MTILERIAHAQAYLEKVQNPIAEIDNRLNEYYSAIDYIQKEGDCFKKRNEYYHEFYERLNTVYEQAMKLDNASMMQQLRDMREIVFRAFRALNYVGKYTTAVSQLSSSAAEVVKSIPEEYAKISQFIEENPPDVL